ncbi:hypothetical protein PP175_18810 [Aneurinibacillus sp. Ricciae_BoGa-3]|uniref:hypothetical protein n=1 Tax=Aneurinibacillus sp. Ricciae_BoGa-3 TaxID=3022697 RepID=UPI00234043DF|nr:hypothetical protein [Aneurinibacillus sp. Ricciae_BoGa-3]WCK53386.1 hypothetical protein PP175_18810 [Aneurinibacillus sp. Ricciae_BoGa-3]
MREITCPYCTKELTGNHRYEVRCYHCGKYIYLTEGLSPEDNMRRLQEMVPQYAYAYVPKKVREYVDKYGLAQSGPTTLKWFKDNEAEARQKIEAFISEKVDPETLSELHRAYKGDAPFLLYVLDKLRFPVPRAPLEWDIDSFDSAEF